MTSLSNSPCWPVFKGGCQQLLFLEYWETSANPVVALTEVSASAAEKTWSRHCYHSWGVCVHWVHWLIWNSGTSVFYWFWLVALGASNSKLKGKKKKRTIFKCITFGNWLLKFWKVIMASKNYCIFALFLWTSSILSQTQFFVLFPELSSEHLWFKGVMKGTHSIIDSLCPKETVTWRSTLPWALHKYAQGVKEPLVMELSSYWNTSFLIFHLYFF